MTPWATARSTWRRKPRRASSFGRLAGMLAALHSITALLLSAWVMRICAWSLPPTWSGKGRNEMRRKRSFPILSGDRSSAGERCNRCCPGVPARLVDGGWRRGRLDWRRLLLERHDRSAGRREHGGWRIYTGGWLLERGSLCACRTKAVPAPGEPLTGFRDAAARGQWVV